ncbi:plasma membrane calcium [Polyrhizophydium stewartii]|uniref:Plasma membrane calcium n=1 Tax=Polyrhizophydium stewartii TaxID=2732419 RepID=A0ABR4N3R3_9FUNG
MVVLTPEAVLDLLDPKNPELCAKWGRAPGIAAMLRSDLAAGLCGTSSEEAHAMRRAVFGTNALPEPVLKSIFQFMWDALQDKTLLVLCAAAVVEMAIGVYKFKFAPEEKRDNLALIDGGAIVVAVLIVVMVGSISDFRKQNQFRQLSDFSKSLSETKVVRDAETVQVPTASLLVGDIVLIQTGDVVPADGVLIEGFQVQTDESTLTGEPISINKDLGNDPFLLSGTKVVSGVGRMIVVATGVNSLNGRSLLALEVEPEATPLQEKLGRIADMIAKFGVAAAIAMVVVLLVAYFIASPPSTKDSFAITQDVISLLILAITIVVVAVPEGLPLAVTISLAHATLRMLKDNNLVRHLAACETMGNATTICSDKTGTLTMNKMTVVQGVLLETHFEHADIPATVSAKLRGDKASAQQTAAFAKLLDLVAASLNVNSTAAETRNKDGDIAFNGSKTEVALLEFTRLLGFEYAKHRDAVKLTAIAPFSSERKRMSCIMRQPADTAFEAALGLDADEAAPADAAHRDWVCAKGASEIILGLSDRFVDGDGRVRPMTAAKRAEFAGIIDSFASQALRTIGAAIRPVPPAHAAAAAAATDASNGDGNGDGAEVEIPDSERLIFVGLFGILDPLRPEVPAAVASCQSAGIVVRMVTGDNIATARAIARSCGILTADGVAMEGPVFRALPQDELDAVLPRLQVLARSSPLDKQILVNSLKRLGHTVAVTGDGTNDAPALAAADVGFSMGIAGTEVSKEASDIVLMDDNFASLVKAVVWGRCVYDSIRKFLQFQLTVNVSAVVLTVITSFYTTVSGPKTIVSVLSAVQLLWINLIMDTFAALALATDPPSPDLLDRKPSSRAESIISPDMFKMIVGQGVYQVAACLVLFFQGPHWWGDRVYDPNSVKEVGVDVTTASIIFNTYVFCQVFNEINCRSITRDINVFKGFFKNGMFLFILFLTIVLQAIIVQFAGVIFKTNPSGLDCMPNYSLPAWLHKPTAEMDESAVPKIVAVDISGAQAESPSADERKLDAKRPKAHGPQGSTSTLSSPLMNVKSSSQASSTDESITPAPVTAMGEMAKGEVADSQDTIQEASPASEAPAAHRTKHGHEMWVKAIRRTRMQVRVVGHFMAPRNSPLTRASTAPSSFPAIYLPPPSLVVPPADGPRSVSSPHLPIPGPSAAPSLAQAGLSPAFANVVVAAMSAQHDHPDATPTPPPPPVLQELPVRRESRWSTLRDVVRTVSVVNAFRSGRARRIDFATLQVADVDAIRRTRAARVLQHVQ